MKNKLIIIFVLLFSVNHFSQLVILPPTKIAKSSFAIIVDEKTYLQTRVAVLEYKKAVEGDGLSVYVIINNWKNPDEVKHEIKKLYSKKPKLEGVVFVGDIPIAMIRNAQHLCSAFKMDEDRYSWFRSSVPSDRFYDDFDLEFKYLKQDSTNSLCFYYSLLPESPQRIEREIYSARIKPSGKNINKYEEIKNFLFKAANQKKFHEKIDEGFVFTGQGYISDDLTAWADERLLLKEQFPQLFKPGGRIKNYHHEMSDDLKEVLLVELQHKNLDMAIFHAHGDDNLQLLLDYPKAEMINQNVEAIKLFLRSKLRAANDKKQSIEKTKEYYQQEYDIPESWFEGAFSDSIIKMDSLLSYSLDIHLEDIRRITPTAKFIIFDECFNGSFHLDEYVAGEYIFGDGNVICAEANSVNVLQDKWADEYLGLLNEGVRIGNRHREINLLESHLFGDPTFHYSSDSKFDMNDKMVNERKNQKFWNSLLQNENPNLRSLAVEMLCSNLKGLFEQKLIWFYNNDQSIIVRLHSLKCLAQMNENSFKEILKKSINDPFEYIRRKSTEWMGEIGDTLFLPLLVHSALFEESKRVNFNGSSAINNISVTKAIKEFEKQIDSLPQIASKQLIKKQIFESLNRTKVWLYDELLINIISDTLKLKNKLSEIRTFRNYKFVESIPYLLKILQDEQEEPKIRTYIAEVLGWYNFSIKKNEIIRICEEMINSSILPEDLKAEILKTKNRLLEGANHVYLP